MQCPLCGTEECPEKGVLKGGIKKKKKGKRDKKKGGKKGQGKGITLSKKTLIQFFNFDDSQDSLVPWIDKQ